MPAAHHTCFILLLRNLPLKAPSPSALGRFIRLSTTATRIAGGVLGQRLLHGRAGIDWQPVGDVLTEVLGQMKGPVLKLGQMASQWQGVLPEPIIGALASLQNRVPAMPFSDIEKQLKAVYGSDLSAYFLHIEPDPFAAASLGQVHRAVSREWHQLVLKILYPGIAAICAADLKQLRRLLPLGRLFRAPAAQLEAVHAQLARSVAEELDYAAEMQRLQRYHAHFKDCDRVLVPEPLPALCRPGVLALSYLPGLSFAKVADASPALREQLAQTLVHWLCRQAFELGELHADPHAGNFAYTPQGQLVAYDFGCMQSMSDALLAAYMQCYRALQAGSAEQLESGFQALGLRQPGTPVPWALYRQLQDLLGPLIQPAATWDFAASGLHAQVQTLVPDVLARLGSLQPAPTTILVNRVLEGHYWSFTRLGVCLPLAALLEPHLQAWQAGAAQ